MTVLISQEVGVCNCWLCTDVQVFRLRLTMAEYETTRLMSS